MTSTLYVDNLQPSLGTQVEIPALKPNAGQIVQTTAMKKISNFQVGFLTTSWTAVSGLITLSITPKQENSVFRVCLDWCAYAPASQYMGTLILTSVNGGAYANYNSDAVVSWTGGTAQWSKESLDTVTTAPYSLGDTLTFQPWARTYTTASYCYWGWGTTLGSQVTFYAQEIAQ